LALIYVYAYFVDKISKSPPILAGLAPPDNTI
jgi:hypothetical protein